MLSTICTWDILWDILWDIDYAIQSIPNENFMLWLLHNSQTMFRYSWERTLLASKAGIPVSNLSPSTMYEFQVTLTDSQKQEKYFSGITSGCTLPGKLLLLQHRWWNKGVAGDYVPHK